MSNPKIKLPRGFRISHQKVVLTVDMLTKSIVGYAELTMYIQRPDICASEGGVRLNARQLQISECTMNGVKTDFLYRNYQELVVPQTDMSVAPLRDLDTYSSYLKAALTASDQGDLLVHLPQGMPTLTEETPVTLRITYMLANPVGGVHFVTPSQDAYPDRLHHMYTHNQTDGARMWMPCFDGLNERCTWDLEISCSAADIVVASGTLVDQLLSPDEARRTFVYRVGVPTSAHHIALAVGPFEAHADTDPSLAATVTHFTLPGRAKDLALSVSCVGPAYKFLEEYLGLPFPHESYKQVFVEDAYATSNVVATLSIFSTSLLYEAGTIDQVFLTRYKLVFSLAMQYFGCYITPRTWADQYLMYGLAGYLARLFGRKIFGNNEYRYQLFRDAQWVVANDTGRLPALYHDRYAHPAEVHGEIFKRKAPLVMYMIEKKIREEEFRKILNSLLKSSTTEGQANSAEWMTLNTRRFFKTIKTHIGQDMKHFSSRWVEGKGVPHINCGFWFNRKRHQTEFALRQVPARPDEPLSLYSGSIVIRLSELDGVYDHVVSFDDDMHEFEFPCRSRMRKKRKKGAKGGTGGINDDDEDELMTPAPSTGPGVTGKRNDTPLMFICIDPEFEFLHKLEFKQPEFMWINQLEDKDVVSQSEAMDGLRAFPTTGTIAALAQLLKNQRVFYRVRMDAAHMIARLTSKDTQWAGLEQLTSTFRSFFYDTDGGMLMPNDFRDLCLYHVQTALPDAIASVQTAEGNTPSDVLEFLLELLKSNDNSGNPYSDNYYLASVVRAVGRTHTSGATDADRVSKQIARLLQVERLMPSYHNTVTVACLEALCNFQIDKRLPRDVHLFKTHCAYGHYHDVRVAAAKALLQLDPRESLGFLLDFVESDPSPYFRYDLLATMARMCAETPIATGASAASLRTLFDEPGVVHRLWGLLNGSASAFDCRIRVALQQLYRTLFGMDTPLCVQGTVASSVKGKRPLAASGPASATLVTSGGVNKVKIRLAGPSPVVTAVPSHNTPPASVASVAKQAPPTVKKEPTEDQPLEPVRIKIKRPAGTTPTMASVPINTHSTLSHDDGTTTTSSSSSSSSTTTSSSTSVPHTTTPASDTPSLSSTSLPPLSLSSEAGSKSSQSERKPKEKRPRHTPDQHVVIPEPAPAPAPAPAPVPSPAPAPEPAAAGEPPKTLPKLKIKLGGVSLGQ